jgi:hypothetical protein
MPINKNLDQILEQIKPVLEKIWEDFPEEKKVLAKRSFENIVKLAQQLLLAKASNDEEKIESTKVSLRHSITGLLSLSISCISSLEDPIKSTVYNASLEVFGNLLTELFDLYK